MHPGCVEILLAAGAFESARAKDGSTPWSELADAAEDRRPDDENVEKVATLLRNSYGLRAWGRRGWLVMLKASRDRENIRRCAELMAENSSVQVARREEGAPEEAGNLCGIQDCGRSEGRADGGMGGPRICVAHAVGDEMECGVETNGEGKMQAGDASLESLVSWLLDVGEGGTFRLVVGFL